MPRRNPHANPGRPLRINKVRRAAPASSTDPKPPAASTKAARTERRRAAKAGGATQGTPSVPPAERPADAVREASRATVRPISILNGGLTVQPVIKLPEPTPGICAFSCGETNVDELCSPGRDAVGCAERHSLRKRVAELERWRSRHTQESNGGRQTDDLCG